jgi:hypothetical protein
MNAPSFGDEPQVPSGSNGGAGGGIAAYLHLSLHGIPPPPQKEVSAQKRADAWYAKILERSHGYKFVAIDDEMIFKVRSRLFTHLAHIPMLHL